MRLIFALIFLSLCCGTLEAERAALRLQNAGFEDGDAASGPRHWTFKPKVAGPETAASPSWKWKPAGGRNGGGCITGGVSSEEDDGSWRQREIPVSEGARWLRVSVWMKSEDVRSSGGIVTIGFTGVDGNAVGDERRAISVRASRDWTRYVGYVPVPQGANNLWVACSVSYAFTKCGLFRWDDIDVVPVDAPVGPVTVHVDDTPPPAPTLEEKQRGFMVFSRSYMRTVFKNTVPKADERVASITITTGLNEYEPVAIVIRALRDLRGVRVSVSDLKGDGSSVSSDYVDVRSVSFRTRRGQARWGLFNETVMHDVPLILEKRDGVDIHAGENQPFWLTVGVHGDILPGTYKGCVEIAASEPATMRLPLTLTVRPVLAIRPEGILFAMYARMARPLEWIEETFADLRAHGMTSIAVSGNAGMPMRFERGRPHIEWTGDSALERNLDACVKYNLTEPALWLMGNAIPAFCEQAGPMESEAFAAAYRETIRQIVARVEDRGWPEIIFQPVDEPFEWEQRMTRNKRLLELLKSVPGVRTEGDGMNGKWENLTPDIYALTDVINLHDGPMLDRHAPVDMPAWWHFHRKAKADGKQIWFYNIDLTGWHPEPVRFMSGFGLWKAQADGIIEWCYMVPVSESDPGAVYGNPAALLYRYPAASGESGGPTIAYEAVREGIDDYRYLVGLRMLVDQARAHRDSEVRALATRLWSDVTARLDEVNFEACAGVAMQGDWTGHCEVLPDGRRIVRGEHKLANGWLIGDYDVLRGRIVCAIEELSNAIAKRPARTPQ